MKFLFVKLYLGRCGAVRHGSVVASVGSSGGRAKCSGWSEMGGPIMVLIMVLSELVGNKRVQTENKWE